MKLFTFPIRLLFSTTWFTFRAGLKAGALPVRGGVIAGRKLGAKSVVLLALGIAIGIVIGREIGIRSVGCEHEHEHEHGHGHGHDEEHEHDDGPGHVDEFSRLFEQTQDVTDV